MKKFNKQAKAIYSKIVIYNSKKEKRTLSKYACLSRKGIRRKKDFEGPDRPNIRPVFCRDADRVIHSLSYSRYIDKTQVFYLFPSDHITHRTLHVQLVSKIGRVIGRSLKLNEDLIEAISLAHDIGHPPFGHDGEKILDEICRENKIGSFSHNVQGVRWLEIIERDGKGLNLSLQVLDGVLCHNGELPQEKYFPNLDKDWKMFDKEYQESLKDSKNNYKLIPMTLEGCVVRIADIIAYLGRDIEDAITVGLIKKRSKIPLYVKKIIGNNNKKIVDNLVMNLIANSYDKKYLMFEKQYFNALNKLYKYNMKYIYTNPKVKQHRIIRHMIRNLFCQYLDDLKTVNKKSSIYLFLKPMSSDYLLSTPDNRKVIDFISGMTDRFLINEYKKYFFPKSYGYTI